MARGGFKKAKTLSEDTSSLDKKSLSSEKSIVVQTMVKQEFDSEDVTETFRKRSLDPLTEHLGCTSYFHKMRWPWFVYEYGGLNHPLEVDRFYHEIKLALDIGTVKDSLRNYKEELLKENGIKYIVLESASDMKNLAMRLS